MHISTHPAGSFCWFELSTSDQHAAKHFYQSLFDWGVHDSPIGPSELYSMFKLDGRDVAAAFTMRAEDRAQHVPPHWMLYVSVENADATAARAHELGGKVVAPAFDVMGHGRMAVIQDPGGAFISLWQPMTHAGTGITGIPHTVCWADLRTSDQEEAAAFYRGVFGWTTTAGADHPAKPGDYYHIVNGTDFIGGIPPPDQRNPSAPAHWLIYFAVTDCAASTSKAKTLGGRAFVETMQIGENGWISVIADPQGAVFALHEAKQ